MENNYLGFNVFVGQKKPENIVNTKTKCPFCDRSNLTDIIAQSGNMLLIKNKYQVLDDAYQTVLIETDECDSDISIYSRKHLHELFHFGIHHWLDMASSQEFKSVLFFKNHGPLSGGTIRHPHMQIIGLNSIDYTSAISRDQFTGIVIDKTAGVELNLSLYPHVGFSELNIITDNNQKIDQIADYIQVAAHYLLNNFNVHLKSYNIFFYLIDGLIKVKVMPRFATSPLYIGYDIHLVPSTLENTVKRIQELYFTK